MAYEVVVVDDQVNNHYKKIEPLIKPKIKKYVEPKIEKVWRDKIGAHDYLYQVQIKTGHFPNHHNYTILF